MLYLFGLPVLNITPFVGYMSFISYLADKQCLFFFFDADSYQTIAEYH